MKVIARILLAALLVVGIETVALASKGVGDIKPDAARLIR